MKSSNERLLPVRTGIGLLVLALLPSSALGQAPLIVMQSPSAGVITGQPVSFSVGISGNPAPSCQWQEAPNGGTSWTNLNDSNGFSGSATSTLAIGAVTAAMSGEQFRMVATNTSGSVTSTPVILTVTPLPAGDAVEYKFSTLAGVAGNRGSANGAGSAAQFAYPFGMTVDIAGNVYVADSYNSTIRKITPMGVVTTLAGSAGDQGSGDGTGTAARFDYPYGIAVDSTGNLYVADTDNSTIRKITPMGVVTTLAGSAGNQGSADGTGNAAQFDYPQSVVVDTLGNIYVADTQNQTIRKVTPLGVVTTLAGTAGSPGSADGTGNAAQFNSPTSVAVDFAGNVYVADTGNSTVRKITPAGVVTTLAGSAGNPGSSDGTGSNAQFYQPGGLSVDNAGSVYVADFGNSTIRKVTAAGVVTTLAGTPGQRGSTDGTGGVVQFNFPNGVAANNAGSIYVADTYNCTIRKGIPMAVIPITITTSPQNAAVNSGQNAIFQVAASSAAPLSYHWQMLAPGTQAWAYLVDADEFSGTATATLFITGAIGELNGAQFQCVASNSETSALSGPATLTVNFLSEVEQSPSTAVISGQPLSFSVGVTGYPAPSFQWQVSADGGNTWTNLSDGNGFSGTGTSDLGIDAVTMSMSGEEFRAVITDVSSSLTSAAVTAEVFPLPPGDSVAYDFIILAGSMWGQGNADGAGSAAQFLRPEGIAVDSAGNVYVADAGNATIRRITPAGVVTTLAGGYPGSADGTGSAAQFSEMWGVAVDGAGNVYVADTYNCTIRKVTAAGVVTTLAGSAGSAGSNDGTGEAAHFNYPEGIAVDGTDNIYVADTDNFTVRKITPAGVVTTLAGTASVPGSSDGTGGAARFYLPAGVAVDNLGNVYVADSGNATVRRITPAGVVTTLAGTAGVRGSADGTGSAAQFEGLNGVAVDNAGNVYVADHYTNSTIRKVTAAGVVTTLTGDVGTGTPNDNGIGSAAMFDYPFGVAVDNAGNLYVADNQTYVVCKGSPTVVGPVAIAPTILLQPVSQSVTAGGTTTLSVIATGSPTFTYQWLFDGAPIPGATGPALTLSNIGTAQAGAYSVIVTSGTSSMTSTTATVTVGKGAWLTNLSTRAYVAPALNPENVLIAGFVTTGTAEKSVLVRGVGPGLQQFGLTGYLPNPSVTIYSGSTAGPTLTGWSPSLVSVFKSLGAFQLVAGSEDTAIVETFNPGPYTTVVGSVDGKQNGIVLAELYDADLGAPANRLINLSARAFVGTGANILIAGFVVSGNSSETLLIRAVGPGLSLFNLSGTLTTPLLQLYDSNPTNSPNGPQLIASIANWGGPPTQGPSTVGAGLQAATAAVMTSAGAFSLPSYTALNGLVMGLGDAAMVVTLPPGAYTAQVQDANGGTGIALVEIYEVP